MEPEQAERQAVADQWKAEVAAAIAAGEWSAAKMAVGRWLSITPDDFFSAVGNAPHGFDFLSGAISAEGFLYPDSYIFSRSRSPRTNW